MQAASILTPVSPGDRPRAELLLALADTKLVLGNWHVRCLFNGKSLPDYAALLAMASSAFGHARVLYEQLARLGYDYAWLERGRAADEIHSMALLDAPPVHWQDFVVAVYLADSATWLQAARFIDDSDRTLAALARRIGEETWFHLQCAIGWATEIARDPPSATKALDALSRRHADALAWFRGTPGDAGADARRVAFDQSVRQLLQTLGHADHRLEGVVPHGNAVHAPEAPLLRRIPLPAGLYEVVRFKDAEAVP